MAGILTFDLDALRPLAEHAMKATEFNAGECARRQPALQLVKDHGVYLMSNGLPGLPVGANVVYANESNPKTMDFDTWYDASVEILGGDDSVITLNVAQAVLDGLKRGARIMSIDVRDDSMLEVFFSNRPAKPSAQRADVKEERSRNALRKAKRKERRRNKAMPRPAV